MSTDPVPGPPRSAWRELLPPLLALAVLAGLAHLGAARWVDWRERLAALGPAAPVAYLALWVLLVPCGLPAAALGLTAGFVFGLGAGAAWATAGLLASGLLMHEMGRRWLQPRAARAAAGNTGLSRLLAAAATGGVRLNLLARLSPLNYALVSYTLAAGGAPWRPYTAGLGGALPGLMVYVWLGAAAAAGVQGPVTVRRGVLGFSALALVLLVALLARRLGRGPDDAPAPPPAQP